MSLFFVRVQRMITVGLTPGLKFLARIKKKQTIGFDELAHRIQARSSMTRGDAYGVLLQLSDIMVEELMEGNPIEIAGVGTIYPDFRAKAVNTLEEVTVDTITSRRLKFRPDNKLRDKIKTIKVELDPIEEIKGLQLKTDEPNP